MSSDITRRDIKRFMRKAINLYGHKEVKKALGQAAKPLINQAKVNAPVYKGKNGDNKHYRYLRGIEVADYQAGNLKRSIRQLRHLRSSKNPDKLAIHVGARTHKERTASAYGSFKGNKVDGYYGHWVNDGGPNNTPTRFWDKAIDAQSQTVKNRIGKNLLQIIRKNARKKGIGG